jgi:hypothetical protein
MIEEIHAGSYLDDPIEVSDWRGEPLSWGGPALSGGHIHYKRWMKENTLQNRSRTPFWSAVLHVASSVNPFNSLSFRTYYFRQLRLSRPAG